MWVSDEDCRRGLGGGDPRRGGGGLKGFPVCCGGGSVEVSEDDVSILVGYFGSNGVNDCGCVLQVGSTGKDG